MQDRLTILQRSVEEGFRLRRHQSESARGVQPGESDRDEPADRGLRGQAAGCGEGVEAVGLLQAVVDLRWRSAPRQPDRLDQYEDSVGATRYHLLGRVLASELEQLCSGVAARVVFTGLAW